MSQVRLNVIECSTTDGVSLRRRGRPVESPCQVEGTGALRNLRLPLLLDGRRLEGSNDPLRIEMLQLVILGHELGEHPREFIDLRGQAQFLHQSVRVLLQLLGLDLLVRVDEVDALVEVLDLLTSLLVLARLVLGQVVQEDLSGELREGSREDVRLELEELVDSILVLYSVEDVGG